jgi:GT2 family glycosyltransferase
MDDRFISVIIPTAGRIQDLKRLLSSLSAQTYKNFEVVVVNKGSINDVSEVLKKFNGKMRIKLLREDQGLTKQLNLGIAESEGSIIVRTDDDTYPLSTWLNELIKPFELKHNIGGVTGPSIVPRDMRKNRDSLLFIEKMLTSKKLMYSLLRVFYLYIILEGKWDHPGLITRSGTTTWGSAFGVHYGGTDLIEVMFMSPANMAIRRDVLDKVGFFDENYRGIGTYCEPDMALRILRAGYIMVYNPKAVVYHLVSTRGVFSARASTYNEGYNLIYFLLKNIIPYYGISCLPRVLLNIFFTGGYWLYLFRKTKNVESLKGFIGMIKAVGDKL